MGTHRRQFITRGALLLVAALLVSSGVALADGGFSGSSLASMPGTVTPVVYARNTGWTPSVPAGLSASEIANSVVHAAGLDASVDTSVAATASDQGPGVSLAFDVPTDGTLAENLHSVWRADLVQGVITEALAAGPTPVIGSTIRGELPSGETINLGGGMGYIQPGQSYSSGSDAIIKAQVSSLLPQWNLDARSIDVLHVGQPEPEVVVTTTDPIATAAAALSIINGLFWDQAYPIYDGYFFQVDNADGTPILVQAVSYRAGKGHYWAAPSIESASSLSHG